MMRAIELQLRNEVINEGGKGFDLSELGNSELGNFE
jgi:hypothetical protein